MIQIIILLFSLGITGLVAAQELRLATGNEYPPFSDEKLLNGGLTTDLVRRTYGQFSQPIDIEFLPWKRGYEETQAHRFLGTFPYTHNAERAAVFLYSDPLFTMEEFFFTRRDAEIDYRQDEDLRGLRACKALGYNTKEIQRFLDAGLITLQRVPRVENCFKMLALGRVDLVSADIFLAWQTAQGIYGTEARQRFRQLDKVLNRDSELHLIIAKDHPNAEQYLRQFNQGLATLRQSGEWEAVVNRHLSGMAP